MRTRHTLLSLLLLAIAPLAACGGDDDGGTGPATATPASVVKVQGDGQTGEVGKALPTNPTVEVRDADGNPMENEEVEFSVTSGGGSVSTTSTTTDIEGRASTTWTLGTNSSQIQRIEVSAGSASTTFTAQARAAAATEIQAVAGGGQAADPGTSLPLPLVARVVDRYGNGVPDVTVEFAAETGSVSPSQTTTDSEGKARTTGTVGGLAELSGSASILPGTLPRPRVTVDYEETLEAARTTSFTATAPAVGSVGFDAQVRSGPGTTWSLDGGSLPPGLSLSSDGRITGVPGTVGEYQFTIQASEDGSAGVSETRTVVVCEAPLQLSPGQTHSAAPPPEGECGIFLPSGSQGDRYRVAVLWPSSSTTSDDASVRLRIRGDGVTSATAPALSAGVPSSSSFRLPYERFHWDLEVMRTTAEVHRRLLGEARGLTARLGPDAVLPDRRRGAARVAGLRQAPEMRTFFEPENSCSPETATLRAERILETEEMVVYQDSAQRVDTPVDSAVVRRVADYYRDYGKPVTDDYFGGIPDIDGNGKFIVLVTPFEDTPGQDALAFVLSRDFHSAAECEGSNEAELTYFSAGGINAMESGVGPQSFQALGALVHEVKHIASLYNRVQAGDLAGRPSWIEEGTADIAAEVSSRLAWGATGGPAPDGRVTAQSFSGEPPVTEENWGILVRLARITHTFASQPNALTTDPTAASTNHTFYGSSWHFHRFLGDAYRGGMVADSSFFRKQNGPAADPGVGFLESELGTSLEQLLEMHAVAVMANGHSAAAQVERTIAGYSFPSAAEIFCAPNPLGVYPWTVTTTGSREQGDCTDGFDPDAEIQDPAAPFTDDTFEGPMGRGGWRIHEFVSNGTGQGAEINVNVDTRALSEARVLVARLQ